MALIWADNFSWWTGATQERRYYLNNNGQLQVPSQTAYVAGIGGIGLNTQVIVFFDSSGLEICEITVSVTGHPTVKYGFSGGPTTVVSTHVVSAVPHYYEMKATNVGTGLANGTLVIQVDGFVIPDLNLSGITHSSGNGSNQQIGIIQSQVAAFGVSNYYICDLTGGVNNNFLGPVAVYALTPVADGPDQNFPTNVPNAQPNNYKNVNETPADDDTSYDATTNVGDVNDYDFSNLPIPATQNVLGFVAFATAKVATSGAAQFASVYEQSGTKVIGANVTLSTSYEGVITAYDSNPVTGLPFTNADISAMALGVKRTA